MKKFAIIACLLVLALTVVGCRGAEETAWADGTYVGVGQGHNGDVEVEVVVSSGEITEINVLSHGDTPGIADNAINNIPAAIIEAQSTDIDGVSGATNTGDGILEAVNNALNN